MVRVLPFGQALVCNGCQTSVPGGPGYRFNVEARYCRSASNSGVSNSIPTVKASPAAVHDRTVHRFRVPELPCSKNALDPGLTGLVRLSRAPPLERSSNRAGCRTL